MQKADITGHPEILRLFQRLMSLHPGLCISKLTQALQTLGRVHLTGLVGYFSVTLGRHSPLPAKGSWTNHFRNSRITCRQLIIYSAQKLCPLRQKLCLSPNKTLPKLFLNYRKQPLEKTSPFQTTSGERQNQGPHPDIPCRFLHPNIILLPVQLTPTPISLLPHSTTVSSQTVKNS